MYWVTMTDKFMSDWGYAEGLINKLIFDCETFDQALIVVDNAEVRSEMKHVNIRTTKPYYSPSRYLAQNKTKEYRNWYKVNYFRRRKYENELEDKRRELTA